MIMNKRLTLWERYVLSKLMLVATLFILGGNLAMADIVIVDGSTIADGWTNGYTNSSGTISAPFTIISNSEIIAINNNYLTSNNAITLEEGQRIIIKAKFNGESNNVPSISIKTSSSGGTWSYTEKEKFDNKLIKSSDGYIEIISDVLSSETCYLQFVCSYVAITNITIVDTYELIIDEDRPTAFNSKNAKKFRVRYTAQEGWNTICVPFPLKTYTMDNLSTIFGSNSIAYSLTKYENGSLLFTKASSCYANTPYLVHVENCISNPNGVVIDLGNNTPSFVLPDNHKTTITGSSATFQGTYAPIDMEGKYGVTGSGTIQKGGAGSNMPGYRAYFTGVSAPADGARPTIVFSEEEMPTGIGAVQLLENTKDVYNLNGQKVAQTRKGIYIVNGRKIVVK